jgi:hypothetical protein
LVYGSKEQVIKTINSITNPPTRPKYVFCHSATYKPKFSGPGYYILFNDGKSLQLSKGKVQNDISRAIIGVLESDPAFVPGRIDIVFSEARDPKINGAYRED